MMNVNYANPAEAPLLRRQLPVVAHQELHGQPFSLPADNYDLDAEWGPSSRDVRHRFFAMVNIGLPKNTRVALFAQGSSAAPYNIITASTPTATRVISDRPAGVTRNTRAARRTWNLNLRLSKTFNFGPQRRRRDGIRAFRGGGGGGEAAAAVPAAAGR